MDGSAVTSNGCSSGGPRFGSQCPYDLTAQSVVTRSEGSDAPFWLSWALHTHTVETLHTGKSCAHKKWDCELVHDVREMTLRLDLWSNTLIHTHRHMGTHRKLVHSQPPTRITSSFTINVTLFLVTKP